MGQTWQGWRPPSTVPPGPSGRRCCARPRPGAEPPAEEAMGEQEDLPTERTQASEAARLPRADVDPRRPSRSQGTAAEGPSQALCLTWRIRDRETFARFRAEGTRSRK